MEIQQIIHLKHDYPFLQSFYYERLKARKKVSIINRCVALNRLREVVVDESQFDEYLNTGKNVNALMEGMSRNDIFFLLTRISPEIEQKHPELTLYFSGMIKAIKNSFPEFREQKWLNRFDAYPHLENIQF